MEQTRCAIASNTQVMPGVHLMWLEAPSIARSAQPGQFVTVRCGDFPLRRPLSVHQCRLDQDSGTSEVAVLFRIAGRGTLWLSQRRAGETVDIVGPLGRGFRIPEAKPGEPRHILLVAGGLGIAPLVFLIQHVLEPPMAKASPPHRITLLHGVSTAAQLYSFDLARSSTSSASESPLPLPAETLRGRGMQGSVPRGVEFIPVTEDGSAGKKGMVTDILPEFLGSADNIYACGPLAMYETMAGMAYRAESHGLSGNRGFPLPLGGLHGQSGLRRCQVSLEVRMGCGFGACYGCTVKTRKGLKQVCRDGPVFDLDDIIWQEVRL